MRVFTKNEEVLKIDPLRIKCHPEQIKSVASKHLKVLICLVIESNKDVATPSQLKDLLEPRMSVSLTEMSSLDPKNRRSGEEFTVMLKRKLPLPQQPPYFCSSPVPSLSPIPPTHCTGEFLNLLILLLPSISRQAPPPPTHPTPYFLVKSLLVSGSDMITQIP